jgi:hypothetical protein
VCPEHGPGAAPRNARKRFSGLPAPTSEPVPHGLHAVEVRDLAVYDALVELA